MASRNYYVVLGVASTETDQGIRAAFRDLVKRHHPDIVGPAGVVPFRAIKEAYEVLGDPRRRQEYDDLIKNKRSKQAAEPHRADERERDRDQDQNQDRARDRDHQRWRRPPNLREFVRELSLRGDLVDARPSREDIFARLERNFTGLNVPKGEHARELTVDVALSPEEARAGTRLRLGVPAFVPCTRCGGRGCFACHGEGTREHERHTNVDVPPMSGSGATFVVPLAGLGIHNTILNVRVRVDRTVEPSAEG